MADKFVEVVVYLAIAVAVVVVLYIIARVSGVYSSDIATAKKIAQKSKDACASLKKDADKFLKKNAASEGNRAEKEIRDFKIRQMGAIKKLMRSTARLGRCVHMYDDNSSCAAEVSLLDATVRKIQKTYYAMAKLLVADNFKILSNCAQNVLKLYEQLSSDLESAEIALESDLTFWVK